MGFITNITSTPVTGILIGGVPSGMDNDQGNIRAGGNISETNKFSSNALGEGNAFVTLVSGVNNVIAVAGSTWNFEDGRGVIVRATTSLAGTSSNVLLAGASDSANGTSINSVTVVRSRLYKTAVRAGDWNEYTGSWSSTPSVVESGAYNVGAGVDNASTVRTSGTDHAANPTSALPGELTQHQGVLGAPTNLDYKPRYLW